jgi:hypothetical protein
MYTITDYPSLKSLKDALKAGLEVGIFQPGPFADNTALDGVVYLEGPHYPRPHTWYAKAEAKNGILVRILK